MKYIYKYIDIININPVTSSEASKTQFAMLYLYPTLLQLSGLLFLVKGPFKSTPLFSVLVHLVGGWVPWVY